MYVVDSYIEGGGPDPPLPSGRAPTRNGFGVLRHEKIRDNLHPILVARRAACIGRQRDERGGQKGLT